MTNISRLYRGLVIFRAFSEVVLVGSFYPKRSPYEWRLKRTKYSIAKTKQAFLLIVAEEDPGLLGFRGSPVDNELTEKQ